MPRQLYRKLSAMANKRSLTVDQMAHELLVKKMVETQKMEFDIYWNQIVGKVAKVKEEINVKLEELHSFLLDIIEKHGVIPERKGENT